MHNALQEAFVVGCLSDVRTFSPPHGKSLLLEMWQLKHIHKSELYKIHKTVGKLDKKRELRDLLMAQIPSSADTWLKRRYEIDFTSAI